MARKSITRNLPYWPSFHLYACTSLCTLWLITFSNVYSNVNQFYMAGLMTMPMIVIEVLLMRMTYMNKKLNAVIISLSCIALIAFYLCIRVQAGVTDKQFLNGTIPHHAAAILMSKKSASEDPDIQKLQQEIISSQQEEMKLMKAKLKELND